MSFHSLIVLTGGKVDAAFVHAHNFKPPTDRVEHLRGLFGCTTLHVTHGVVCHISHMRWPNEDNFSGNVFELKRGRWAAVAPGG